MIAALHRLPLWQPGRLVSLWDMLRFDAISFYKVTQQLTFLRHYIQFTEDFKSGQMNPEEPVGDSADGILDGIESIKEPLEVLGARLSIVAINRLMDRLKARDNKPITFVQLREAAEVINGRIRDELSFAHVFVLDASSMHHFDDAAAPFGDERVAASFRSSVYDISEAGKCLALKRPTACAMHLMRALEAPLVALANAFGVGAERENWDKIISQIESLMKPENAHKRTKPISREDMEFFAKAAVQFRMFKDAWRNHVMHAREKYTEEQADIIYRSVSAFMRSLAPHFSEPTAFD